MIQYDSNGIKTQNFIEIINEYEEALKSTFGESFKVDKGSPIGSLILACSTNEVAIHELIAWFTNNQMNVETAEGIFLDYICAKNRIFRKLPQKTTVDLIIRGTKNTPFNKNDITVIDKQENVIYNLKDDCVLNDAGYTIATFECEYFGDYNIYNDTVFEIQTPIVGLNTIELDYQNCNLTIGRYAETDNELRERHKDTVGQCGRFTMEATKANIANLDGINSVKYFENDTESTDTNGLPMKSYEYVVDGGDENAITDIIFFNKVLGVRAYGTTVIPKYDSEGNIYNIGYTKAEQINIGLNIDIEINHSQSEAWFNTVKQNIVNQFNSIQKIGVNVKDYNYITVLTKFPEITNINSVQIYNLKSPSNKQTQLTIGNKQIAKLSINDIQITMGS